MRFLRWSWLPREVFAAGVPDGRAIISPTGGHALVGHYAGALREITSFLQTGKERRPPK